jgi:membrane protein required for beta-lactamase induction
MEWIVLRSRRDVSFWLPVLLAVVALVALAIAAQLWTPAYLARLEALRAADPDAAAASAESALRTMGALVCGFTLLVAAVLFRYFQLGRREGRVPPSGWWSVGAHRAMVGATARRFCLAGMALSLGMGLCGVGFLLTVRRFLAAAGAS